MLYIYMYTYIYIYIGTFSSRFQTITILEYKQANFDNFDNLYLIS